MHHDARDWRLGLAGKSVCVDALSHMRTHIGQHITPYAKVLRGDHEDQERPLCQPCVKWGVMAATTKFEIEGGRPYKRG